MKTLPFFIIALFFTTATIQGQFVGFGTTFGIDLYQNARVPESGLDSYTTGAAVTNFNVGPKMWLGNGKVSFSLEAQASFAPFAFDTKDYKGLGMISFPLIASLNFNGLSTTQRGFGTGFSIGGGAQYTNSDLYFLSDDYGGIPEGNRPGYFPTYFGQLAFGGGGAGICMNLYVRYGVGPDKAAFFSTGIMMSINSTRVKGLKDIPQSIQK